ncbi:MAG: HIT family protein [Turicibacter sp.]
MKVMIKESECLGCQLAKKELSTHVIYEDEYVICILDHEPFNRGHTLILPKRHVIDVDELDNETAHAVMKASSLISKALKLAYHPDGITICQNGGIFNDLTHYHMHVIPRFKEQCFADFYKEGEDDLQQIKDYQFEQVIREMKESLNRGGADTSN